MAEMKRRGRVAVFLNPDGTPKTARVNGVITDDGHACFEEQRAALGRLLGWEAARVSDADVVEYMARGEKRARKYLRGRIR